MPTPPHTHHHHLARLHGLLANGDTMNAAAAAEQLLQLLQENAGMPGRDAWLALVTGLRVSYGLPVAPRRTSSIKWRFKDRLLRHSSAKFPLRRRWTIGQQ